MSLKKEIRFLRKSRNLTQADFARQFHISNGTIAMWETGKRQPDNGMLVRIADYFEVPVDFLLGRPLPNLKLIDVLNRLRGEKEMDTFLKECGLNENEINTIKENPKSLEIETLKKIFEHSNQQMPFEQLLFSTGKTYDDLEREFFKKIQSNNKDNNQTLKNYPTTISTTDQKRLNALLRTEQVFGPEYVDKLIELLILQCKEAENKKQ